jgi:hypothetical protein
VESAFEESDVVAIEPVTGGNSTVAVLDAGDNELYATTFDYSVGLRAVRLLVLPAPPGAEKIALYKDDVLQDIETRTANSPTVTITSPAAGSTLGSSVNVSWTTSDVDGGQLTSYVLFSRDGGTTWLPLGGPTQATQITEPTGTLPSASNAVIRVAVSDGMNTTIATVGGLQLAPNRAPNVAIMSPATGVQFRPGANVVMSGVADDLEDSTLPLTSFTWKTSNPPSTLGTGPWLNVDSLATGNHTITLEAVDSGGAIGTASVAITIQ